MEASERVCPFCGEPPGVGVFCAACGRNLAAVDRLPTRSEWERDQGDPPPESVATTAPADDRPIDERASEAVAAFLAAMHAAGDPGTVETLIAPVVLRRHKLRGWVVRPVDRDDEAKPRRYEPGLVLSVDGRFHQLDSELRGWGQRDFPRYEHTVGKEPIELPAQEALVGELATLLRDNGVAAGPPFARA